MIISLTDQPAGHITAFILFDTAIGLEYRMEICTRFGGSTPTVTLTLTSATARPHPEDYGSSAIEYYREAAIAFWMQLQRLVIDTPDLDAAEPVLHDAVDAADAALKAEEAYHAKNAENYTTTKCWECKEEFKEYRTKNVDQCPNCGADIPPF